MASMDPFNNTYTRVDRRYVIHPNTPSGQIVYVECTDPPKPKEPRFKRIGDLVFDLDSGKSFPIRKMK